jgi:Zn-dependent peptidase ImmA (M78 family)
LLKPFEDPEWQADCLAGELLMPYDLIKGMSDEEVALQCGVTMAAAKYQLSKI